MYIAQMCIDRTLAVIANDWQDLLLPLPALNLQEVNTNLKIKF